MMKIILRAFGHISLALLKKLTKDLSKVKVHKNHEFEIGNGIKMLPKFRLQDYGKRPVFSAPYILDSLEKEEKKSNIAFYAITDFILADEDISDPSLYAGLCRDETQVLIMSTARLKNYDTILTVANHELGHLFGLDHCDDTDCIMKEGRHNVDVESSEYWCKKCWAILSKS